MVKYYHGSSEPNLEYLYPRDNEFQGNTRYGVFLSDNILTAGRYGYYVYSVEIEDESVLIDDPSEVDSYYISEEVDCVFDHITTDIRQRQLHRLVSENLTDLEKDSILQEFY